MVAADMLSQDEINALLSQAGGSFDEEPAAAPSFSKPSAPSIPAHGAPLSQPMPAQVIKGSIDFLNDISLRVNVFLAKTKVPLKEALQLAKGSVVAMDKMNGEPADIYVNGQIFAQGEIVVVEGNFGIRITKMLELNEREEILKRL